MNSGDSARRRVSLELSEELLNWLDGLKPQFGLRNRGAILEHVLREVRSQGLDDDDDAENEDSDPACDQLDAGQGRHADATRLDETSAIVLISSGLVSTRDPEVDPAATSEPGLSGASRQLRQGSDGIQLPGFVRRQARELGRSLQVSPKTDASPGLSLISPRQLEEALKRVEQHWLEVYGQPAQEPVLEAAMVWLAKDVWPRSDHSDGRPFTWNLTQHVIGSFTEAWSSADPGLARVIVAAGILEDPFSGSTLELRVPTLITRFVQWHRSRQKRTTSFEAIDQTMTVHGALRLLQLPTVADRPYSLQEIRDAYREQAQCHHPDAGGSAEAMRRLNEAYQFLKERYRRAA